MNKETIENVKETIETETEKVNAWRKYCFEEILGNSATEEQITRLVDSDVHHEEVLNLRNRECPTDLLVEIVT